MSHKLTNLPFLLLLLSTFLVSCSNESGTADTQSSVSASIQEASVQENRAEIDGNLFQLLDQPAVDLLADSRLQIINYWASWCLPCIEEMPELAAFRQEHNESVEIYAVNFDRPDIDQLRQEVETLGVEIPALVEDPNERLGYQRPTVLPTTVVMIEGQVKDVLVGPQTKETLEAVLHKWGT